MKMKNSAQDTGKVPPTDRKANFWQQQLPPIKSRPPHPLLSKGTVACNDRLQKHCQLKSSAQIGSGLPAVDWDSEALSLSQDNDLRMGNGKASCPVETGYRNSLGEGRRSPKSDNISGRYKDFSIAV